MTRIIHGTIAVCLFSWAVFAQNTGTSPIRPTHADVKYGAHEKQSLDFWRAGADAPAPLVIFVHGGGFTKGDKGTDAASRKGASGPGFKPQILAALLDQGFAVASVNYRLAPGREEADNERFRPRQIADVKAAIRHLRAGAGEYGIDPGRFGMWGLSAGAALVNLAGVTGERTAWDAHGDNQQVPSRVRAVVSFYGPSSSYMPGETNVLKHVSADDAAFLLIHGTADKTVPIKNSQDFHAALLKAGHQQDENAVLKEVSGAGHGLGDRFDEFIPVSVTFLKSHLGSSP